MKSLDSRFHGNDSKATYKQTLNKRFQIGINKDWEPFYTIWVGIRDFCENLFCFCRSLKYHDLKKQRNYKDNDDMKILA